MLISNYLKIQIKRMADAANVELTDKHYQVLMFTHDYYEKFKVGPLFLNIKKNLNISKDEINKMFPHGLNSVYTWIGIPIQNPDNSCRSIPDLYVDDYREVYFDHNATTYLREEISEMLIEFCKGRYGFANPSSSSIAGEKVFTRITRARKTIAELLQVSPEEIVFTSSGSEANNFAIKGFAFKNLDKKGTIITTKAEHASILNTMKFLEKIGFQIKYLNINNEGILNPAALKNAITKDTILVSTIYVNNEIGTINPIKDIGEICKEKNIPLHVDAVQAFGKIKINPKDLGISLMSCSGHKIYAPKGVGFLFIDKNISIEPLIHGGTQEVGMRAGTENAAYIMAFALAANLAHDEMEKENIRILGLRDYFLTKLKQVAPDIIINGSLTSRLPNNLSIGFPDVDSGALMLSLNKIGISVSAGSACSAGKIKTSHVLEAINADTKKYGTIRFGFGLNTRLSDIDYFIKYIPQIIEKIINFRQEK